MTGSKIEGANFGSNWILDSDDHKFITKVHDMAEQIEKGGRFTYDRVNKLTVATNKLGFWQTVYRKIFGISKAEKQEYENITTAVKDINYKTYNILKTEKNLEELTDQEVNQLEIGLKKIYEQISKIKACNIEQENKTSRKDLEPLLEMNRQALLDLAKQPYVAPNNSLRQPL